MAIDLQPKTKRLWILDLVGRYQPWADRTECIGAFPFYPLAGSLHLKRAFGNVINHTVARNV